MPIILFFLFSGYMKPMFLAFLTFLLYNHTYFEYTQSYKKEDKKLKEFIFENYYRRIGFTEENIFYSTKHKKIETTKKIFAKDY